MLNIFSSGVSLDMKLMEDANERKTDKAVQSMDP